MKKIMIVDDEMLVRIGIKSIVDWEKHGYQMVAEASDGEEALTLIKQEQPDIVLTDLKMSPMDGFTLIERCKTEFPRVRFVVLSSYNDMDNVKKAMKLGAKDYVFKLKINAQSLVSMLDEVSSEIEEEEPPVQQKTSNVNMKNIPAIKQRLLQTVVEKSYLSPEEVQKEMELLKLKVSFEKPYLVLYISIDDFELKVFNDVIQEVQVLKFSLGNILEEVLSKNFSCDVYGFFGGTLVVTLELEREYGAMVSQLKESFEQAKEYIKRYLNITISGAISLSYLGTGQVAEALKEVELCIKNRLYKGAEYLYVPNEQKKSAKVLRTSYEGIVSDLEKVINKKGKDLISYLEHFFDSVSSLDGAQENDVRECYFEMYQCLNKNAMGYGIDINKLTDDEGSRLYYVILKGDTLTLIEKSFLTVAKRFIELLNSGKKQTVRQDILAAKEYIRNNLSEHFTVTSVAEMLNINGSYFSHLFKKETGKSFVDYVNYVRINKAKELLINTDYRIYEIAAMVGIDSPNYFSALFKKITGKNPNDFRQK